MFLKTQVPPWRSFLAACIALALADGSFADPTPTDSPGNSSKNLWERQTLSGDWDSERSQLEEKGITFSLEYTHEYLANVSGGTRRQGEYNGLIVGGAEVDLEKLAHWNGGLFHADALSTLGNSLSARAIGDDSNVSNINYRNSLRLAELWLQQSFLDDRLALRAGQLAWDVNFGGSAISDDLPGGDLFLNSDFGALPILSFNVPVPIFAIYAPGIMARIEPVENLYLQVAAYDGNPAPGDFGDPTPGARIGARRNDHGFRWRLAGDEGVLWAAEIGYRLHPSAQQEAETVPPVERLATHGARRVHGETEGGQERLPGIYKLGCFYHSDEFTGFCTGEALGGNCGCYAVASQMVWCEEGAQGLTVFARAALAPEDRNVLDFAMDCGAVWKGVLPGRDDDNLGLAFSQKGYSDEFSAAELAVGGAAHGHESILELSYEFRAAGWLSVQPDLQYVIHPAGDPEARNAWVIGCRSTIVF